MSRYDKNKLSKLYDNQTLINKLLKTLDSLNYKTDIAIALLNVKK